MAAFKRGKVMDYHSGGSGPSTFDRRSFVPLKTEADARAFPSRMVLAAGTESAPAVVKTAADLVRIDHADILRGYIEATDRLKSLIRRIDKTVVVPDFDEPGDHGGGTEDSFLPSFRRFNAVHFTLQRYIEKLFEVLEKTA
jgi:hypothetical protein